MLTRIKLAFNTELLLLFRRSQEWAYPLGFFVVVISLFPLAFTPDPAFIQKYFSGCVWIAILFASLLSITNVFYSDLEDGYLEQLLLSPYALTETLVAKLAAHWLVTSFPIILLTPFISYLFGLSSSSIFALTLGLLFGSPVLSLLGSTYVALTLGLRQQGVLLGLLLLPLSTPILIFGVSVVQLAQAGFSIIGSLLFLAGLCVFSITLLPFAIAAALR